MAQIFSVSQAVEAGVLDGSSCAFGVFDGVHAGHRFLIDSAIRDAQSSKRQSVAITFNIDPDEMFRANALKKLLSNDDRIDLLSKTGVDAVVVMDFTEEFASLSPSEFLDRAFGVAIPSVLHVGRDFRFGNMAAGDANDLATWGRARGMRVCAHDLVSKEGHPVTATRIRQLLSEGDVVAAASLLTYPYTIRERVVAGRGEGRDMGFRTANLVVEPVRRVLREGVYGAYAIVDGVRYKAAVSVGVSPMFEGQTDAYSEVHILDFAGDIYEQVISVQFVSWLRPMIKFESTDELIRTVLGNIAWVRDNL